MISEDVLWFLLTVQTLIFLIEYVDNVIQDLVLIPKISVFKVNKKGEMLIVTSLMEKEFV